MKEICPFLSRNHRQEQICNVGINFDYVGRNREMCRVCPLANLGDVPLCKNLEVYAFADRVVDKSNGNVEFFRIVLIETECPTNPAQDRCAGCPGLDLLENVIAVEAMMLNAAYPQREPA